MNKHNNQRQQNTAQKQARADMWHMLNAFVTTPDIHAMHYANNVGELNITRAEHDTQQQRRIGFVTDAVSNSEINAPDDYDEDDDSDDSDDGYNDFVNTFVRWFD